MTTVHFILPDGSRQTVHGSGPSVMHVAVLGGIAGIVAECGGSAMCGTCHVYVDESFVPKLVALTSVEDEILEGVAAERRPNSRLSCQIPISAELDGLVVQVPAA